MEIVPRKSEEQKLETRRRLIEAAKAEFASRGFAGARFDEISIAAGYSKGTIYNYFDSKADLFQEILIEWVELLMPAAESLPEGSASERLVGIVREGNRIFSKDLALARVVTDRLASIGPVGVPASDGRPEAVDWVANEFARGLETGEFESDRSPSELARLFTGILNAFRNLALTEHPVITFDEVPELIDQHFLRNLRVER